MMEVQSQLHPYLWTKQDAGQKKRNIKNKQQNCVQVLAVRWTDQSPPEAVIKHVTGIQDTVLQK